MKNDPFSYDDYEAAINHRVKSSIPIKWKFPRISQFKKNVSPKNNS